MSVARVSASLFDLRLSTKEHSPGGETIELRAEGCGRVNYTTGRGPVVGKQVQPGRGSCVGREL